MSKPRLKGPTIGVRLELEIDETLRARAAAAGISPAEIIAGQITALLRKNDRAQPDSPRDTNSPEIDETPAHRHTKETLIAGGLHKCSCGSIRGKDGSWS